MDGRIERRRLRQIERALEITDPEWVTTMRGRPCGSRLPLRVVLAVLGATAVVTGAVMSAFLLIFAGVLVLMVAACIQFSTPSRRRSHNTTR